MPPRIRAILIVTALLAAPVVLLLVTLDRIAARTDRYDRAADDLCETLATYLETHAGFLPPSESDFRALPSVTSLADGSIRILRPDGTRGDPFDLSAFRIFWGANCRGGATHILVHPLHPDDDPYSRRLTAVARGLPPLPKPPPRPAPPPLHDPEEWDTILATADAGTLVAYLRHHLDRSKRLTEAEQSDVAFRLGMLKDPSAVESLRQYVRSYESPLVQHRRLARPITDFLDGWEQSAAYFATHEGEWRAVAGDWLPLWYDLLAADTGGFVWQTIERWYGRAKLNRMIRDLSKQGHRIPFWTASAPIESVFSDRCPEIPALIEPAPNESWSDFVNRWRATPQPIRCFW